MRFSSSRSIDRNRPLINLASMIDVTFLLLSFFLVTSGMGRLEGRLSGALGTSSGAAGDGRRCGEDVEITLTSAIVHRPAP